MVDRYVEKEVLLKQAQSYMLANYRDAFSDTGETSENRKAQLKSNIRQFLRENGYDENETDSLYNDMAEYSILTEYLNRNDIEEININGWDDIAITYAEGDTEKLDRHFYSPSHAVDVVKRLLHHSGMIIDNSVPIAQGHLPGNTRITAIKAPVVDDERGIAVSIRLIQMKTLDRESLIQKGFATHEMLSFLETCLRYGVSMVVAGRTSSGKTTLLNMLLSSIPDNKRVYTIESGAREMNLIRRNEDGVITNNIVHTLSRPSENELYDITQEDLVVSALRFNPDVICVGEMRDSEANAAVEASFTGHTMISTVHSGPGEAAHMRIALLCQRKFAIDFDLSLMQAAQAFPIVAFAHKLEDNTRHLMDISECVVGHDGKREYRTLYRYVLCQQGDAPGIQMRGYFEKVNNMSDSLKERFLQLGVPSEKIARFMKTREEEGWHTI